MSALFPSPLSLPSGEKCTTLTTLGYGDALTRTNYITVTPVTGSTTAPRQGPAPLPSTFTNLSRPAEEIEVYQWSFGDGSTLLTTGGATSTETHPVHVYTQAGSFTVILTFGLSRLD